MNAEQVILLTVEDEMMKHVLWFSSRRCSCGNWKLAKGPNFGTMQLQHAKHVAAVIAGRLALPESYRRTA